MSLTNNAPERVKEISTNTLALEGTDGSRQELRPCRQLDADFASRLRGDSLVRLGAIFPCEYQQIGQGARRWRGRRELLDENHPSFIFAGGGA